MDRAFRSRHRFVLIVALLVAASGAAMPSKAQPTGGLKPAPANAALQPLTLLRPLVTSVTKPVTTTVTALPNAVATQQLLGATSGLVQGATGTLNGVATGGGSLVTGLTSDLGTTLGGVTTTLTNDTRALLGGATSSLGSVVQMPTGRTIPLSSGNLLPVSTSISTLGRPLAVSGNNGATTLVAGDLGDLATAAVTGQRRLQIQALLRDNPQQVEADGRGQPVVRGEALALSPTPDALAKAREAGFVVVEESRLEGLDLQVVVLKAPPGLSAIQAVDRLRAMDRQGQYDFNHLYQPSGEARSAKTAVAGALPRSAAGVRVGLIDGGVAERHPSLSGVRIVQQGFAGPVLASAHGVAVASLMVGGQGDFRGATQAATLYVADVYGGSPAGGSASGLVRALAWMAQNQTPVVNISLVGPTNLTLAAAVKAMIARGHLLVAAVGNDGPAAPPLYPAAYPGVVAVTAVDARRRLLPEAGRGTHVDFAAPGADMAAAGLDGGFVTVRGTSFAAPLVAGRLAGLLAQPDRAGAARALAALARQAVDLGAAGPDRVYGKGLVAFDLRTDPVTVAAKGAVLSGP